VTEPEAIKLAQKWAFTLPQNYCNEDPDKFIPHSWVVQALLEAANGPYRLKCEDYFK